MIKIAYSNTYCHPLPEGHRFPMEKYELIPEQLLYEGVFSHDNFFEPEMDEEVVQGVHHEDYILKLKLGELSRNEMRKIGFPYSYSLYQREVIIANGTLQAAKSAIEYGAAFNVAGGTHHAFHNRGEGFCIFNDIAVAAKKLLDDKLVKKILVVDLDVHQGNGTASIFSDDDAVFTFSMHGKNNYPMFKEKSDLDIPLDDGTTDETYLQLLQKHLPQIIETQKPDFIFYQCGVDILETDKLGKLSVSMKGCFERDLIVFQLAFKYGIPVTAVMGGGYSPKVKDVVNAHCQTFKIAASLFS